MLRGGLRGASCGAVDQGASPTLGFRHQTASATMAQPLVEPSQIDGDHAGRWIELPTQQTGDRPPLLVRDAVEPHNADGLQPVALQACRDDIPEPIESRVAVHQTPTRWRSLPSQR